ncbi:hypothetical protein Pelo_15954 [Pelomyxa schiedti]|nr:hypothetical protein Pelo_15954 [Pelomyxa schiedti]
MHRVPVRAQQRGPPPSSTSRNHNHHHQQHYADENQYDHSYQGEAPYADYDDEDEDEYEGEDEEALEEACSFVYEGGPAGSGYQQGDRRRPGAAVGARDSRPTRGPPPPPSVRGDDDYGSSRGGHDCDDDDDTGSQWIGGGDHNYDDDAGEEEEVEGGGGGGGGGANGGRITRDDVVGELRVLGYTDLPDEVIDDFVAELNQLNSMSGGTETSAPDHRGDKARHQPRENQPPEEDEPEHEPQSFDGVYDDDDDDEDEDGGEDSYTPVDENSTEAQSTLSYANQPGGIHQPIIHNHYMQHFHTCPRHTCNRNTTTPPDYQRQQREQTPIQSPRLVVQPRTSVQSGGATPRSSLSSTQRSSYSKDSTRPLSRTGLSSTSLASTRTSTSTITTTGSEYSYFYDGTMHATPKPVPPYIVLSGKVQARPMRAQHTSSDPVWMYHKNKGAWDKNKFLQRMERMQLPKSSSLY